MRRIRMPNCYGYTIYRMTAWRGGGLAITRSAEDSRKWSLTHIRSGRRITSFDPNLSLRTARACAALLVAALDWTTFPDDPWNLPDAVQSQIITFTMAVAEMFDAEAH